jgi:hypothetical protein
MVHIFILKLEIHNQKNHKSDVFGFDSVIADTKKPNVTSLIVYPITDSTKVNQSKIPIALGLYQQKDGSYLAEKVGANGKIGFGIISTDYDNVLEWKWDI